MNRASLVLLFALPLGCAFTSKGEALTPRYFSPALEAAPRAAEGNGAPPELRIGRIEPAAYLEERIAYRVNDSELAYYEDRRWTEPPEQFVRRALESALFETHTFQRIISGAAPTLDVEVLGFDEVREAKPRARLSLLISLRDERRSLLERTITLESPLDLAGDNDAGRALARAMADALSRATRDISQQVAAELQRQTTSSVAAQ
ncbi:MAG TPA: ABC-type transport auxiliary lipoprotein family protein [Polyangiaceae bacterium]|nr:ABC-type transport auxiliary lipoprotein family protein [Polyangiaceae bacterium]